MIFHSQPCLLYCNDNRINQIVQQEYANKYLESIGAYPTKDNVDFVLNNLAIKDALVLPVWARSKIIIIPGMNNKEGEMGQSMQDFLRYDIALYFH